MLYRWLRQPLETSAEMIQDYGKGFRDHGESWIGIHFGIRAKTESDAYLGDTYLGYCIIVTDPEFKI